MNPTDRWLQKWENKFGRFAPPYIIVLVVGGMALVYAMKFLDRADLAAFLDFDRDAILSGQVWRLITFVFMVPDFGLIMTVLELYLLWLMGSALDREWGSFKFDVFYFAGMIGTALAGLLTGYATNIYINLSLFLAFAIIFPNYELLLFFILPVKVKILAYVDVVLLLGMLIFNTWPGRLAVLLSLINIAIFFWHDGKKTIEHARRRAKWKRDINGK